MTVRWLGGALLAAVVAGPIVAAPILMSAGYGSYGAGGIAAGIVASLGSLLLTVPFGFAFAIIPALVGSSLLGWAGSRYRAGRQPLTWAAAGVVLGTAVGAALTGEVMLDDAIFGIVGGLCALAARWRTRWID